MQSEPKLNSTITCPHCNESKAETMPTDACQWFYECSFCNTVLEPNKGDCCVYCSFGTVKCPPIQLGDSCCGSSK
ncbi:GDCCVxC domain-containing (seleno)protein [Marinicella sediminis]|uniref:GDCCVxC domain-containing (Seleno)protein n=1 Tax=Marinicella sediminis TaxID=1792834 RepID=A0ABV7J7W4_9GAMM|nr:GDCCVxC domain-containing (seleno)protein [Marinicella sediminis]